MANPYPIGSAPGGGILFSDGSVRQVSVGGYSNFKSSSGNSKPLLPKTTVGHDEDYLRAQAEAQRIADQRAIAAKELSQRQAMIREANRQQAIQEYRTSQRLQPTEGIGYASPTPNYYSQNASSPTPRTVLLNRVANLPAAVTPAAQPGFTSKVLSYFGKHSNALSEARNFLTYDKFLRDRINRLQTKEYRNYSQGGLGFQEGAQLFAAQFIKQLTNAGISYTELPTVLNELRKNPSIIKNIPQAILDAGSQFGEQLRQSPSSALGTIVGQAVLAYAENKGIDLAERGAVRVLAKTLYRDSEPNALGIRMIKNIPKIGDIDIIPEGKAGMGLEVDPLRAIREAGVGDLYRDTPVLPRSSPIERRILKVVAQQGDVVGGSYSQEALLRPKYTRPHQDLDILTKDRVALIKELKKEFGNELQFIKKTHSIQAVYRGRQVADLVPYEIGEGGYVSRFGTVRHKGLNLARPEARLGGKVIQLGMGKKASKVLKDIEALYGNKINLDIPAVKGAYGFSKQELRRYIGKRGPLTTAQVDLLGKGILKPDELEVKRFLYATPYNLETGRAQLRVSRLGISRNRAMKILDLLTEDISFKKPKPQIFVLPDERIFPRGNITSKGRLVSTPRGFQVPEFSSELEVVLGEGYAIKRGKTLSRVEIEGKLVPIIELEKVRLSPKARSLFEERTNLIKRLGRGMSKTDREGVIDAIKSKNKALSTQLEKETGLSYKKTLSRAPRRVLYADLKKPAFSAARYVSQITSREARRQVLSSAPSRLSSGRSQTQVSRVSQSQPSRGSSGPSYGRSASPSRSPPSSPNQSQPSRGSSGSSYQRSPPSSPPRRPPRYPPRPGPSPRPRPQLSPEQYKKKLQEGGKFVGYHVWAKSGGRYYRLNRMPLTKQDALNRGAYAADNTTSRRLVIRPGGLTRSFGTIRPEERGYYAKTQQKYRQYKIRKGIKRGLTNTYIEKTRYAIDTRGEKQGLTIARLIKQKRYLARNALNRRKSRR